nr:unnamed protein product [Callosobruchus chinensis]
MRPMKSTKQNVTNTRLKKSSAQERLSHKLQFEDEIPYWRKMQIPKMTIGLKYMIHEILLIRDDEVKM